MKANNILIILGMHRSGTSLITRWLHACGLQVGDTLLGPETGNDEGHFEDLDFVHLHEELLRARKLPHTGLTNKPVINLTVLQQTTLQNLIAGKNQLYDQWGWKDPRTCLFLDIYREILPAAKYVIILRGYQSVVSSLLNRDNKGLQRYYQSKGSVYKFFLRMKRKYNKDWLYKKYAKKYLEVWIAYNEQLLKHIKALPVNNFVVVDYLALLDDDKPFFSQLEKWGFVLHYNDFKSVFNRQLIGQPINIDVLVNDTQLINKAIQLDNTLREFLSHIRQS